MHKLNMTPWKQKTLAAAATLALAGLSLDVSAFALGAVTVHSHLGEPLRAEIEVPQISEAEAKTLQATLASPQAFQAAGVEYNPAVVGVRVTLHQRKNGQSYLRLVGTRPVNEPFLGIVIESSWSNGRVVRDYTMLIDPADPGKRQTAEANQAQTSASKNGGAKPAVAEQVTSARPSKANRSSRTAAASGDGETVTVRRGDTAYGLVASITPQGISLDQMLVALQRANPHAFIRGNVNLLKAGAVVTLPTEEQASAITRSAARRAVVAQSRDFHAYRSGLASHAPRTATASAGRSDSGAVQAHVQEAQPRQSSGDNLILTRGKTRAQAEERIAQNRQARENNEREAELKRNIDQLKQLQTAAAGTAAAPGGSEPAAPSAAPQINVPATAPVVESTPPAAPPPAPAAVEPQQPPATPVPPPPVAATPEAPPAPPVAEPPAPPAAETTPAEPPAPPPPPPEQPPAPVTPPAPVVAEEPSMLDSLLQEPLIPGIGIGLLALLAGLGFYKIRQSKKKAAPLDSGLSESRLQPDSFFHSSGSRTDSRNSDSSAMSGQTSMAYSPSQLDAAGDVDPVAEADVYLAYGRDMQAEEILKEALLTHPTRVSVHRKLAEIYAKRRDAAALEDIATQAYPLTNGRGSDWDAICVLGNEVDPGNGLYKPGGKPGAKSAAAPAAAASNYGADTEPQVTAQASPQPAASAAPAPAVSSTQAKKEELSAAFAAQGPSSVAPALDSTIDFDLDVDLDSITPPAPKEKEKPAAAASSPSSGMIEFDIDALSLDPDSRGAELNTEQPEDADDDPLATKLALAQEFHSIGDTEGARLMAKEVVAEATGALKIRAERFLHEIS